MVTTTFINMTNYYNTATTPLTSMEKNEITTVLNMTEYDNTITYNTFTVTNTTKLALEITSYFLTTPVITLLSDMSVSITVSEVASSPIASATMIPTQPPSIQALVMITIIINDQTVDIESNQFRNEMEKKLADTYVTAKSVFNKRRRRAATSGNTTVEVSECL